MRLHTDFNRLSSNPPHAPPLTEEDEATGVIMTQLGEVEGDIYKSQVAVEELEERCRAANQVGCKVEQPAAQCWCSLASPCFPQPAVVDYGTVLLDASW